MKNKGLILICLLMFVWTISPAQYRVSKLTREDMTGSDKNVSEMSLSYSGDKLNSITVNGNTYPVLREKNKIIFGAKKNEYRTVEFNKEGEVTKVNGKINFKYKKGALKSFIFEEPRIKSKTQFDIYFNENGKLAVAAMSLDDEVANKLLFYDGDNRCVRVETGIKGHETINAQWEGDRLVRLSGYRNSSYVVADHEFIYDDNNNLVEENVYEFDDKKKERVLRYRCLVEYESGAGDEKEILYNFSNWKINLFFDHITFVPFISVIY